MSAQGDGNSNGPGPGIDWRRVSLLWAVPGHAADMAALHATMFDQPWDEAAITSLLAHPGSVALVASAGHPMVVGGFALAQVAADEAEILTIGIAEGWRRHGLGSRLLEALKRAAERAGARSLFLEVAASNAAALALYAKHGFTESGRRKGYYVRPEGAAEDAIVMRCPLGG